MEAIAPNDGKTWVSVTAMISNFLQGLWLQGGLIGTKASEASTVQCGLGTMIHPAEVIELTFKQQMPDPGFEALHEAG